MTNICEHFAGGDDFPAPRDVCEDCIEIGGEWVHLRQCLICLRTMCCDNSPNRHTTAHAHATGHPFIRTAEPGEDWRYCYPDDLIFFRTDHGWEAEAM